MQEALRAYLNRGRDACGGEGGEGGDGEVGGGVGETALVLLSRVVLLYLYS